MKEGYRLQATGHRPENSLHFVFISVIAITYIATRLSILNHLPIFNDEAFYIRWAAIIHENPRSFWISLVDGKTPLFYWINALTFGLFNDPLVSSRIISVISGAMTIMIFFAAGLVVKRPRAGIVAAFLYSILPYAFFNDRLATVDSFHTMLIILCLFASLLCARAKTFSTALSLLLGLAMMAAFYAKTPSLLFAPLPAALILAQRRDRWERRTLINLACAYAIPVAGAIFYLTRDVPIIGGGGSAVFHRSRFFIPLEELSSLPVSMWLNNLGDFRDYLSAYFTIPLSGTAFGALALSAHRRDRESLLIALWTLVPVLIMLFVTRETFSRYYLAPLAPLLLVIGLDTDFLIGVVMEKGKRNRVPILALLIAAAVTYGLSAANFIIPYMKNPASAQWVARDKWQYVDGYPSGYGLDEIIEFLKLRAMKNPITVFTTMSWGNPDDAVWLYLHNVPNVRVIECFWWDKAPVLPEGAGEFPIINNKFQREVIERVDTRELGEVYFVTRSNPFPREFFEAANSGVTPIHDVPKPGGQDSTLIYRLK